MMKNKTGTIIKLMIWFSGLLTALGWIKHIYIYTLQWTELHKWMNEAENQTGKLHVFPDSSPSLPKLIGSSIGGQRGEKKVSDTTPYCLVRYHWVYRGTDANALRINHALCSLELNLHRNNVKIRWTGTQGASASISSIFQDERIIKRANHLYFSTPLFS